MGREDSNHGKTTGLRDTNSSFPLTAHLCHLTVSLYTQFSHLQDEVGTVYPQDSLRTLSDTTCKVLSLEPGTFYEESSPT